MFIAYPRAGGTQLELVPCKSRANYTYYGSLDYDYTRKTSFLRPQVPEFNDAWDSLRYVISKY